MLKIKCGVMPGEIKEYIVGAGATVSDILATAGIDSEGYQIMVNGSPSDTNAALEDGAYVVLSKMVKGN